MSPTATSPVTAPPASTAGSIVVHKSPGFWAETWKRFRRRKLAMAALVSVILLCLVAILSPAIAGTRPVVCKYKGQLYFPCLYYFNTSWQNPIFTKDRFRGKFHQALKDKDPESWAIWPLSFNDPYYAVQGDMWPDRPANPNQNNGHPSAQNWLGTDQTGVDVFAKLVHGTRTALVVGFISMGIAAAIGITLGAIGGYAGGWTDMIISRFTEVVICIPTLVLIIALMALLKEPTIWHMMAIIGLTGWTSISRLTRAEFLRLRESDFVAAARVVGAGHLRIIFRHILPNAMAPVLVPITFGIAGAIFIENALTFLGFGPPPPTTSWGDLLKDGRSNYDLWWLIVFPGMAVFFTVLCYNLIGEGIQAATDPRLRDGRK
ncbi:ABC transporter permease [Planctomyces sp. SH-PL14]|uniref:ABC transporter permease n=1 Tax=Planctomyces sp. SH-PL14 TaxID=1632864 RepID=UPI00078E0E38|nr:ABC transporter permease [Planctomyces sp. SH-PL14]AMV17288.1 Inner membrane ABC transporter permease protein YejE [Planctomyces sp. SH-PL14]